MEFGGLVDIGDENFSQNTWFFKIITNVCLKFTSWGQNALKIIVKSLKLFI